MKLSTKGRYGLTAMLYLARHADEGPLPLRMMDETGIQPDYLEQLLASLRKAGLVCTSRGAQGGYSLARAPEDITVGDVISAVAPSVPCEAELPAHIHFELTHDGREVDFEELIEAQ